LPVRTSGNVRRYFLRSSLRWCRFHGQVNSLKWTSSKEFTDATEAGCRRPIDPSCVYERL
jgi:hypothetical protein